MIAGGIFRQDNPYNTVMNRIGDIAMLSVAWFVCCLPVVTIGVSTAAACEVAREMQEDRDNGIFKGFWRAIKRRFGTGMLLTLFLGVLIALGAFDLWWISRSMAGDMASVLYGVTLAVFIIVAMLFAFLLPLSGRSKLSAGEQIKQSAKLATMKPFIALVVAAIYALPIVRHIAERGDVGTARLVHLWRRRERLGTDVAHPPRLRPPATGLTHTADSLLMRHIPAYSLRDVTICHRSP